MTQKIGINLFCETIDDMEPEEFARFAIAIIGEIGYRGSDAIEAIRKAPKREAIDFTEGLVQLQDLAKELGL